MNTVMLSEAVRRIATELDLSGENFRDEAELIRVLARIIEGKPIDRAFGAPGDWGYSHPVGKALAAKPDGGEVSV